MPPRSSASRRALVTLGLLFSPVLAFPAVRILHGPTPIPGGQATGRDDLTLENDALAASIAVSTAPPWAVPKGALIDAAPMVNGTPERDRITFADFLPNGWSAWPSTRQRVEVVTDTPELAQVRATRNWDAVEIVTLYSLRAGDDAIHIEVAMTNRGKTPVDAQSGLVLWAQGGYFFGVPGLPHRFSGPAAGALADRIVAYDKDWLIALHESGFDRFDFGQKDLLRGHTLAPGQSRSFEGWLQIRPRGDMAPVVAAEIQRRRLPSAVLSGEVRDRDGHPLGSPVVVVQKDGVPYAWTLGRDGRYAIELPAGRYQVYATAEGHTQSAPADLDLPSGANQRHDFSALAPPGHLDLTVASEQGAPLDARLDIKTGQKPVVEYLGKHTFFTELGERGRARIDLAPGAYVLSVGSGAGFSSTALDVRVDVAAGETRRRAVILKRPFLAEQQGWYAADLHHHSDQEDGVTPPADLVRSELAAGLDLLFVSDHDSTANLEALRTIARSLGVPFIPSIELSPSWGHFNAYPVDVDAHMRLEMSTARVQDVFAEAHRIGARYIQVNHPYNPGEGYFASLDRGVAAGGFDPHFDFLEINGSEPSEDGQTLGAAWKFWNQGKPYYLVAGSDTHDVWNDRSGDARVYVHLDAPLTAAAFLESLHQGHSFVSHGPLVFSQPLFGDAAPLDHGHADLHFRLQAAAGLKRASIVCSGRIVRTIDYPAAATSARFDFAATEPGACAVTVEDAAGMSAYSNPIWIGSRPPRVASTP